MLTEQARTAFLEAICGYCRELLDVERVPSDALFLDRGGNSLLATMLANRLEEDHGFRPCIEDILVSSTSEIGDLCAHARHHG